MGACGRLHPSGHVIKAKEKELTQYPQTASMKVADFDETSLSELKAMVEEKSMFLILAVLFECKN